MKKEIPIIEVANIRIQSKIVKTFNVQKVIDIGECVFNASFEAKFDDPKFLFELEVPLLVAITSSSFSETRSHSGAARFVAFMFLMNEVYLDTN